MARTYRRATRGGHGSSKGARREYNGLVRRTPDISNGCSYRRLVPWFCDALGYAAPFYDRKVKEGKGGWRNKYVDPWDDHDENEWAVEWHSSWRVWLFRRDAEADRRMIHRREARQGARRGRPMDT